MSVIAAAFDTSKSARRRLLSTRGEPLFYANWDNALFIHYETDPEILERCVPYDVDLYNGRAFVSVVAFTMRGMRPRFGGPIGELILRPIGTHNFLNVRTYVRYRGEPAIYFMREWLSNRLSVLLGPATFGLPYRLGRIDYRHERASLSGNVSAKEGQFSYEARSTKNSFEICEGRSLTEFLLERYTAFTQFRNAKRFFRIWHEPWQQVPANIDILADDLLASCGAWWRDAQLVGADYSPGVEVWMGWPHKIDSSKGGFGVANGLVL